jgi:hypothetical protein
MDNFRARELAVDTMEEAKTLRFTKVIWLPANSTSIQPLDQGIIQCWKTHIRDQFVSFMVKNFDNGENFKAMMAVLHAICWGISCWENDVSMATIQNCWAKSQCIDWGNEPSRSTIIVEGSQWDGLDSQLNGIRTQLQDLKIRVLSMRFPISRTLLMALMKFVTDEPEGLVDQIVQQYQPEEHKEGDSNDELLLPKVSNLEALHHLQGVRRFEEQQDHCDRSGVDSFYHCANWPKRHKN